MVKKLKRSKKNRIVAGVCAGLGEYLGIDPTVVRLVYCLFTILTGIFPGLALYCIAWSIIPE